MHSAFVWAAPTRTLKAISEKNPVSPSNEGTSILTESLAVTGRDSGVRLGDRGLAAS